MSNEKLPQNQPSGNGQADNSAGQDDARDDTRDDTQADTQAEGVDRYGFGLRMDESPIDDKLDKKIEEAEKRQNDGLIDFRQRMQEMRGEDDASIKLRQKQRGYVEGVDVGPERTFSSFGDMKQYVRDTYNERYF